MPLVMRRRCCADCADSVLAVGYCCGLFDPFQAFRCSTRSIPHASRSRWKVKARATDTYYSASRHETLVKGTAYSIAGPTHPFSVPQVKASGVVNFGTAVFEI